MVLCLCVGLFVRTCAGVGCWWLLFCEITNECNLPHFFFHKNIHIGYMNIHINSEFD